MASPRPIGIIGCSAEGAALCYRTICAEAPARLGPHAHPTVTLHTPSLAAYVDGLERGDLAAVAELTAASADILAEAGAQILICPDNTIHQALPEQFPRPFIHIAEAVRSEAVAMGVKRLAVLGTRWLMESPVYETVMGRAGIETVIPDEVGRESINAIIMEELVLAAPALDCAQRVKDVLAGLAAGGCDGAVLACTELPLVVQGSVAGMPLFDSTRILARAALDAAIADE
ncbi:MAG: amino acid racemase [Pseudomonadota bacterium]